MSMTTKEFNDALQNLHDREVFDKFYQEICPQLIKISLYIFKNESLSHDISQDVFRNLFLCKNLSYVRYPSTWLYTLCRNAGLKYLRKREVELLEDAPYTSFTEKYDGIKVEDILRGLTAQEREIIVLHHLVGFSLKEVAIKQNRRYFAVAKQHTRIIQKLKKKLSKTY